MLKKILVSLIILFLSFGFISAQDVVYDTTTGNPALWMKIKGGPNQTLIRTSYENLGYLTRSKVVVGAGILDGLIAGTDYQDYTFKYDTLTYEFNTNQNINMIIYRYYYNDTTFRNFVGLRKAEIGTDVFDGQYMFICPIVDETSRIKIYNGIGSNKILYKTLQLSDINEGSYGDWQLSHEVTFESYRISRVLRVSKTDDLITSIEENPFGIVVSPNPATDHINVEMAGNGSKKIIRIYSLLVSLMHKEELYDERTMINISSYKPGMYIVMISDAKENILYATKIVVNR